jgi:hypothetical protein
MKDFSRSVLPTAFPLLPDKAPPAKWTPATSHASGLALNRRHARSDEMGAVVASDDRITKVRLVSEGKQPYLNRIRPTGRQAPSPDTPAAQLEA